MLKEPHCGDKERLSAEDWREMAMMAPLDEQHRPLRSLHERRHELRGNVRIEAAREDIERRQLFGKNNFNQKANSNRDNSGGGNGGGGGGGSGGNGGGSSKGGSSPGGSTKGDSSGGGDGNGKGGGGSDGSKQKEKVTSAEDNSTKAPSAPKTTFAAPPPPPPLTTTTAANQQTFSSIPPPPITKPTTTPTPSFFSIPPTETPATQPITTTPPPAAFPSLTSVAMLSSWTQTASSSQGRKGLEPGDPGFTSSYDDTSTNYQPTYTSTSYSYSSASTSINASAIGDAAAATQTPDLPAKQQGGNHHKSELSSGAAHALIALGVIGGLILFGFVIYLILRFLKIDVRGIVGRFVQRDGRSGSFSSVRSWNPTAWRPSLTNWRRQTVDEIPPPYEEAYAPEKVLSASPQRDMKFAPIVIPTTGTTPLVSNPAPFGASSPIEHNPSAGISYFVTNPDRTTMMANNQTPTALNLERNISNASAGSNNATYFGTYNPNLPPAQQYSNQVRQSQGAYMGPNSRLSELSSLSSGFGDAKIDVPESGPTNGNPAPRKSSFVRSGFLSRFSWTTNNNPARDTVYTASSEESAPRFRSVTSWVNQQTSRVQRQNDSDVPAPLEPVARRKPPVTAAFQLAQARASVRHSRQQSQDGAFRAHPGQEVRIGTGSRVPSSILDGNFGGEEGPRYGRS